MLPHILMQSLNATDKVHNTKIKRRREKANTHQFYAFSSYNPGVVQSPCTFKGFTISTHDYKLLKDTSKRLLYAQSQLQETYML